MQTEALTFQDYLVHSFLTLEYYNFQKILLFSSDQVLVIGIKYKKSITKFNK